MSHSSRGGTCSLFFKFDCFLHLVYYLLYLILHMMHTTFHLLFDLSYFFCCFKYKFTTFK